MASTCTLKSMHAIYILGMIYFWFWVDLELVYRTLHQILLFSAFSCFSMDKIKASQLGNLELLFPTHPPLVFLHFLGLTCYFHLLDNSLMFFPTCEVLDRFSKCFIHLWGFCYILVSQPFWALWVVSIQFIFTMREALFMYTIIHNYSMEGYTPIFISSFMWFSLFSSLYFSCVCLWEFLVARSISYASS